MKSLWEKIHTLFDTDDGSLPEVEIKFNTSDAVPKAYDTIRNHSTSFSSKNNYYWSTQKNKEILINFPDNPAEKVTEYIAEPFHVCFTNIKSHSGNQVPDLGVFVFQDSLSIDYKMGSEWNMKALIGFFELLYKLDGLSNSTQLTLKSNVNDPDGELFNKVWMQYKKGRLPNPTDFPRKAVQSPNSLPAG